MTVSKKRCERCGTMFARNKKDSSRQWESRKYCSRSCVNNGRIVKALLYRILDNVEIIPEAGCWIWTGATDPQGYGQMATSFGRAPAKAHRESYEFFVGAIPEGMILRHKCDVPCCINPHHLEPGTYKDNSADMVKRGRMNPASIFNLRPGRPLHIGASAMSIIEQRQRMIEQHPALANVMIKSVGQRMVVIDGKKTIVKGATR